MALAALLHTIHASIQSRAAGCRPFSTLFSVVSCDHSFERSEFCHRCSSRQCHSPPINRIDACLANIRFINRRTMSSTDADAASNVKLDNDVGDAFGCSRNTVTSHIGPLQTAPTERYATHYNMSHPKRGLAMIFNHEFFTISHLKPRCGTNVDCDNLVNTLKTLGFEVNDFHNSTHRDIIKNLERVSNMDHTQHDCLLIAVLSHGEMGLLYAHDTPYKADSIWSYFTADKCPTLAGKPKLFFIQACQGDKLDPGSTLKERTETDGLAAATFRIPTQADFLIAYSTIPGYYSWRNTTRGSWFMQALCLELRDNGVRYDLLTLLTFVCQRVALDFESNTPDNITMHQQKQIPCITSMLTRLVRFTPPKNGIV